MFKTYRPRHKIKYQPIFEYISNNVTQLMSSAICIFKWNNILYYSENKNSQQINVSQECVPSSLCQLNLIYELSSIYYIITCK